MITNHQFERFKNDFENLTEHYREKYGVDKEMNWVKYEKEYAERLRACLREMRPIVKEASQPLLSCLTLIGRPQETSLVDKVVILLLKDIFHVSNRKMANFLSVFSPVNNISTGYKTIERLYSNPLVSMVIHNMFIVTVKRKGIERVNITGDGTGYSLTITKHYATNVRKENDGTRGFAYSFAFLDLDTHMYVGYGTGMRSEKEAFDDAKKMLDQMDLDVETLRLDKYYTNHWIVNEFGADTRFFLLPKKNTTINGGSKWHKIWKSLMYDTNAFLREYYRRENSESGFAADKKSNGWKVWQRRDDRIDGALMCKGIWHNLLWIGND